jgi:hypothetical protein
MQPNKKNNFISNKKYLKKHFFSNKPVRLVALLVLLLANKVAIPFHKNQRFKVVCGKG